MCVHFFFIFLIIKNKVTIFTQNLDKDGQTGTNVKH